MDSSTCTSPQCIRFWKTDVHSAMDMPPRDTARALPAVDDGPVSQDARRLEVVTTLQLRCPTCCHSLAGATSLRCGECGISVQPVLLSEDRIAGWYILVLVGLTMLTTVAFYLSVDVAMPQVGSHPDPWVVPARFLAFLLCVVMSIKTTLATLADEWNWPLLRAGYSVVIALWALLTALPILLLVIGLLLLM